MNRNFLLLMFLVGYSGIYSQNYKSLENKDTVYFYFDYSVQLEKRFTIINPVTKDTSCVYVFNESNPKKRFQRSFLLHRSKYVTFDDATIDKKADIKTITKRFIRKNKDIIIYPKDLEGEKMKQILNSRNLNIVVYIIDIKEKKKRKFIAREVFLNTTPFIEI